MGGEYEPDGEAVAAEGDLQPLAHGLYTAPRRTKFGDVPPDPDAIMEAFLGGTPYLFTGPQYWNALGLAATALFPLQLVYNTKRTGEFEFGVRPTTEKATRSLRSQE